MIPTTIREKTNVCGRRGYSVRLRGKSWSLIGMQNGYPEYFDEAEAWEAAWRDLCRREQVFRGSDCGIYIFDKTVWMNEDVVVYEHLWPRGQGWFALAATIFWELGRFTRIFS